LARARPTRRAREQIASLPWDIREAIDDFIPSLEADPRAAGVELRGTMRGIWRARIGEYRLLYRILGPRDENVVIDSVRHRPRAYPRGRH
jgi:mRNA-degrading endonuclease RelE of RelBE toxin-antitoxin system